MSVPETNLSLLPHSQESHRRDDDGDDEFDREIAGITGHTQSARQSDLRQWTHELGLTFLKRLQTENVRDLPDAHRVFRELHLFPHPEKSGCCHLELTWESLKEEVGKWEETLELARKIERSSAGIFRPPVKLIIGNPIQEMARYLFSQIKGGTENRDSVYDEGPLAPLQEQVELNQNKLETLRKIEDTIFDRLLTDAARATTKVMERKAARTSAGDASSS